MTQVQRQQVFAGLALIVLGLVLYALKYLDQFGSVTFLLVGGAFLTAYFYRKEFGFLIPGCLLLGLAGARFFERAMLSDATLLGLGVGFAGIVVIGLIYERQFRGWPLIPATALVLLGIPDTERIVRTIFDNWPLILVAVGVLILVGAVGRPRRVPPQG